jgi:vanillate O-demethylase ferredoxin subunit
MNMSDSVSKIDVVVSSIRSEATGILSFELRHAHGGTLPQFTAGAHLDVELGDGLVRSYSLVNSPAESHRYVIAVNLDRNSRGGSRHMHEHVRVGDRLRVSVPSNNFPLDEGAAHSVFIAGGIGVTPIWSMIQRLDALGRSWELHYACRSQDCVAFHQVITDAAAKAGSKVRVHLDAEAKGRFLDLAAIVNNAPAGSVFYCCGPAPMLEAYKHATKALPPERARLEHFGAATATPGAAAADFTVVLGRSGKEFKVKEGVTILETLLQNGISHNYSCTQGVCGTCETKVLEGIPDHRDWVLSEDKKASNKVMLICCSMSKTDRLVLDI